MLLPHLSVRCYPHQSARHQHAWHQLIVPIEGALGIAVGHREDRLDRFRGALIAPGEWHAFQGIGDNRFLVLDVGEDSMREMPAVARWLGRGAAAHYFAVEATVQHLARGLLPLLERTARERPADRLQQHGAGLLLLALSELHDGSAQRMPERLRRAVDFIHRHYAGPIRVADIAAAASLGASQMHALFRSVYGMTPMDYVAERRLDGAERLLAERALPIAEIALRCGYADQASLTRAMRARRGTTPGAFRQSGTKTP
ncbi:AraC family transcriptional regulator [Pendulispora rubella]|uniref:AraC family transcriptional regulator n=1 Tax=Pendulispora rubella TaxID=2741070 RepID=A0ABZ2KXR8_9BACT